MYTQLKANKLTAFTAPGGQLISLQLYMAGLLCLHLLLTHSRLP